MKNNETYNMYKGNLAKIVAIGGRKIEFRSTKQCKSFRKSLYQVRQEAISRKDVALIADLDALTCRGEGRFLNFELKFQSKTDLDSARDIFSNQCAVSVRRTAIDEFQSAMKTQKSEVMGTSNNPFGRPRGSVKADPHDTVLDWMKTHAKKHNGRGIHSSKIAKYCGVVGMSHVVECLSTLEGLGLVKRVPKANGDYNWTLGEKAYD
jgi:hypothetical protein|tara:strand:- start:14095 stop:14715 length:621 start_codon:yes stop_codon:yes gene_type:complete